MTNQKSIKDFVVSKKETKRTKPTQIESPPHKRREVVFTETNQLADLATGEHDASTQCLKSPSKDAVIGATKADAKQEAKGVEDDKLNFRVQVEKNLQSVLINHERCSEINSDQQSSKPFDADPTISVETRKQLLVSDINPSIIPVTSTLSGRFPLPSSFLLLEKIFTVMDSIYTWNSGRDELCYFFKVKKAIENAVNRRITVAQVAAIKTIYPEAFEFKLAACKYFGKQVESFSFEVAQRQNCLQSSPSIVDKLKKQEATSLDITNGADNRFKAQIQTFETSAQRKETLHQRLIQYAATFHNSYLERIGMKRVPLDRLKSWHPDFDVEKEIKLPDWTDNEALRVLCKRAVVDSLQNKNECIEIVSSQETAVNQQDSLKDLSKDLNSEIFNKKFVKAHMTASADKQMSLLERIREKERSQIQNAIEKSEQVCKSEIASLYPLIDSLYVLFNQCKKTTLSRQEVFSKLNGSSATAISEQELWSRLTKLSEKIPKWIQIVNLKNEFYLKTVSKLTLTEIKKML